MTISFALAEPSQNIFTGRMLSDKHSTVDHKNSEDIIALPSSGIETAKVEGISLFKLFSADDTLVYSWSVKCSNNPLTGGAKAIVSSDSTESIDYIYARVKSYDYDDTLLDEAEDSATNASHAGAKAGNGSGYVLGDYAYGNHVFKNDGYKDMIKESSDTW